MWWHTATMAGISLAFGGLLSNLEVYLIEEFNIKSISAAKIFNMVNGLVSILPIGAAILADSFLGCYSVIWFSSLISSLGMLLITLTAAFSKLRPPPCQSTGSNNLCTDPTRLQLGVLYLSLALAVLGMSGNRFTLAPMGAYQFDKPKHQGIFFNWYIFVIYTCLIISTTAIVYVQNNVSWAWGFGISTAANALGLLLFVLGTRFYRQLKPQGSPFARLARVVIAAIRNRGVKLSKNPEDYCQDIETKTPTLPTKFFRVLNRAAIKSTQGDVANHEITGSVRKSWKFCAVTEVEDFKNLIKLLPLWTSALLVSVPLAIQMSMGILQALTMDRHLGHNFQIPAASVAVFLSISTCITVCFTDRVLMPVWSKFAPRPMTPLQRIGIGHLVDVLSMAALALVEVRRLKIARSHNLQDQVNAVVPMSIFWLVPSLALAGMGEAFHFPGHIAFYYQEFPMYLKSTSTAVVSLSIGIAFYMGNALIDAIRRSTDWLPDNINKGRLDNVFWVITILGGVNFCYFLVCASLYKYKTVENVVDDDSVNKA
ncbi:OLC1v1004091C1 [Oldenlandia corymbosa var. corymbosa]|uniref:OLC1v1004091C1 n=1 Tax=Oldenlandia corymbosa var. corymbosa TaxID=529605 RepID=A0AAV1DC48_OLDCO|nr:OLC1v1004091C1 [Oldenlandia corymbosa var. corymbosa]